MEQDICYDETRKKPEALVLVELDVSSTSRIVPRCSCRGELVITGEIRSSDGWRTGFNLKCKECGKEWTYSGGVYRKTEEKAD